MYGLDLFSGIGGLSLALHGFVKPLLYCDIESRSRKVLTARMESGHLEKAPIHNDVQTLQKNTYKFKHKPRVICAGFPCTGFSAAGLKTGFDNKESNLFLHILRIIDMFPTIEYLFLENTPAIVSLGLEFIIKELCIKRKFNLRWTLLSACEVGSPQLRRRWYAIAYKNKLPNLSKLDNNIITSWKNPPPRMVYNKPYQRTPRHNLLGMSVVPAAARFAYKFLSENTPKAITSKKLPSKGAIINGIMMRFGNSRDSVMNKCKPLNLVLDPSTYKAPPHADPGHQAIYHKITTRYWATPTAKSFRSTHYVTKRTRTMLGTQIRFEVNTPNHLRSRFVNLNFVEWLMGYPKDYTKSAEK